MSPGCFCPSCGSLRPWQPRSGQRVGGEGSCQGGGGTDGRGPATPPPGGQKASRLSTALSQGRHPGLPVPADTLQRQAWEGISSPGPPLTTSPVARSNSGLGHLPARSSRGPDEETEACTGEMLGWEGIKVVPLNVPFIKVFVSSACSLALRGETLL